MQRNQWILTFCAVLLVVLLFFVGKTKQDSKEGKSKQVTAQQGITLEEYEANKIANNQLPDSLISLVQALKQNEKDVVLLERIAHAYQDNKEYSLQAYTLFKLASLKNQAIDYENAGFAFINAFKNNIDSNISNNIITFALQSFEKVLDIEPDNTNAKIQLAEIYVQNGKEPMKGIEILKKVIEEEPNNVQALTTLGRLSLQSGQYDKAKERLEKVLQLEPQHTEAIYFLAFTEAELGNNEKAIQLMELCKTLVNNPEFDKEIEQFIKELKK